MAGAPRAAATTGCDARDFGVIADGVPHNNVANLLDCFAVAAAAGAEVLLPGGVIDTSEAVASAVVTADSGRTYTNNGGIPLPTATPMTISGEGRGVTVIKLSAGFPRAFDFWWAAGEQRYEGITIRRLTVDRNNLTGVAIAPTTAVAAQVTLPSGVWTTLPGISGTTFRNARFVWFPKTNAGTANGLGMASRIAGMEFQVRNDSDIGHTLEYGDLVQGSLSDHVIVGTAQFGGSVPKGWDMTIEGLTVEDVESVNVSTETAASLTSKKSDSSPNIMIDVQKNGGSVVPSVTNCAVRNVRMNGGESGAYIGGQFGCFIDECWFIDCFHDTMVDPTSNYVSANFMLGQKAWVGRVGITRCHGRRSGDVAYEIDQPWEAHETDCIWEDAYNGVYSTSFVAPARTPSGPPTTSLVLPISQTWDQGEAVVPVRKLPTGISTEGLLQIDDELFRYRVDGETETSLILTRGLNGTKATVHQAGAAVNFVETHKTQIYSVGSTVRNSVVMSNQGAGRGFVQYQQKTFLPLPPLIIKNASIKITGGRPLPGQGIYWTGWQPQIEVRGLRFDQVGLAADTSAPGGSAISWEWNPSDNDVSLSAFSAPRVFGCDNGVHVRGAPEAIEAYKPLQPGNGGALVDVEIIADVEAEQTPIAGEAKR